MNSVIELGVERLQQSKLLLAVTNFNTVNIVQGHLSLQNLRDTTEESSVQVRRWSVVPVRSEETLGLQRLHLTLESQQLVKCVQILVVLALFGLPVEVLHTLDLMFGNIDIGWLGVVHCVQVVSLLHCGRGELVSSHAELRSPGCHQSPALSRQQSS